MSVFQCLFIIKRKTKTKKFFLKTLDVLGILQTKKENKNLQLKITRKEI